MHLDTPPPSPLNWWCIPIGGGTMHWCPECAAPQIEELRAVEAWQVPAEDAGACESCALRDLARRPSEPDPDAGLDLVVACDTGD